MNYGEIKSTWSSVELNLLLCALILVTGKSGCFTDRLKHYSTDNLVVEYEYFFAVV